MGRKRIDPIGTTHRVCRECKKNKAVEDYYASSRLDCKLCYSKKVNANGKAKRSTCEEDARKYFAQRLKDKYAACKRNNVYIDLTEDQLYNLYVNQDMKCNITGMEFDEKSIDFVASLDRIDSDKGYTIKNIQLILNCINKGKSKLPQDTYMEIIIKAGDKYRADQGYRVELVKID